MKLLTAFAFVLASLAATAQEDVVYKEPKPSKESLAYHRYRLYASKSCFSSAKVNAAIKTQIKRDEEENMAMKEAAYKKLTLREKFVYAIIHPESYSQICDAAMPIEEEHKKIFANIVDTYDDYVLSERQEAFLKTNRDSVMKWIKECVNKDNKRIGTNFKRYIVLTNAVEMIPYLTSIYNVQKKDYDILTVLMQLMRDNQYQPFLESAGYKKLYGDDAGYMAYLNANKANIDLIIQRATDFYSGWKK